MARKHTGRRAQRARFARAARSCKGLSRGKFRSCMRKHLKK